MSRDCPKYGFLLTELLVAIAVSTIILSTITVMVAMFFRQAEAGRRSMTQQLALGRIADRFRNDVRAARSVTRSVTSRTMDDDEPGVAWELQSPDRPSVLYRLHGNRLMRIVSHNDGRYQHESFWAPQGSKLQWEEVPHASQRLLRLLIPYTADPSSGGGKQFVVEAILGRHLHSQK